MLYPYYGIHMLMTHIGYLPLILSGVFLNAVAQLALKQGANRLTHMSLSMDNIVPLGIHIALNPWILLGLVLYGASVVLWIVALSRVDVSFAYPMLSIGYIIVAVAGAVLFHEPLGMYKILGIALIIMGVILLSKP